MKQNFKKFLKWTAITTATLILAAIFVIVSTILGVIYNPQGAFHFAQKYMLPADLNITWEHIHFNTLSIKNWDLQAELEIENLHITKKSPYLDLPIDNISVRASLFFWDLKASFQKFHLESASHIRFKPSAKPSSREEKNILQQLQDTLSTIDNLKSRLQFEDLKIDIKFFELLRENADPLQMSFLLVSPFDFKFSMTIPSPAEMKVLAEGSLSPDQENLTAHIKVQGNGLDTTQTMSLNLNRGQATLRSSGPTTYLLEKRKIQAQTELTIDMTRKVSKMNLAFSAKGLPGPVDQVEKGKLSLVTPLEASTEWSESPSQLSVSVPIELYFINKKSRDSLEQACHCKLPKALNLAADGKLWLSTLFSEPKNKTTALDGNYSLESVKNELFKVDVQGQIKIEKKGNELFYAPEIDGSVHLYSLKRLSPIFDAYGILVPAPLDVLDGTVSFNIKGPIASKIPAFLKIDLFSKTQKVKIQSESQIQISKNFKEATVQIFAKIDDLQLDLPPLDPVRGLPRISPDPRIQKKRPIPKSKQSSFKLNLDLQLETTHPGAIRLQAKYFKPSLPITLSIHSSGTKSAKGFFRAEPFDITYLRRTVHVEKLSFNLDQTQDEAIPMAGRFRIQQTDYTIFVDVTGTTKNPNIKMTSEPYLPESEIISVLLYDRTSDQLVSADAETAGGVQAAVADRAIGLFGLWAFASTPIKSFSYNPVTKVYSATLAVSDSVTAAIGTNWESAAHVELRRRISQKWILTASWTPASQDEAESTKLVLQWESRF